MPNTGAPRYAHVQKGPWGLMLLGFALLTAAGGWLGRRETAAVVICGSVALVLGAFATAFHVLKTIDEGDRLGVRFGPVSLFGTSVPYEQITGVEVGRTLVLDGWGIHMSPRGGWVWNIWGRDCVVIYRGDKPIRVGTDDPQGLAAFLRQQAGLT